MYPRGSRAVGLGWKREPVVTTHVAVHHQSLAARSATRQYLKAVGWQCRCLLHLQRPDRIDGCGSPRRQHARHQSHHQQDRGHSHKGA